MNDQVISLQLVRVKCLDETGGRNAERTGNDEISLSGFGIDATGEPVMLPPFRVYSHFDDGDVKEFSPPRTLLTLDVPSAGAFPKVGRAGLILAEIDDSEALTALAQKTFEKLTEQMEGTKQEMMGSGVNATAIDWREVWDVVGPIVYGYVKDLIAAGLADDVFPPKEVSVDIASDDFYWGDGTKLSPEATVEFRGHEGLYYLTYYWEIQTLASSHVGGGGVWQGGSP